MVENGYSDFSTIPYSDFLSNIDNVISECNKTILRLFIVGDGLQIELSNHTSTTKGLMWVDVNNDVFNKATNLISDELMNQQNDKQNFVVFYKV